MFEITVRIDDITNHLFAHSKLKIRDLATGESCVISFSAYTRPVTRGSTWADEEKCKCFPTPIYQIEMDGGSAPINLAGPLRVKLYSDVNTTLQQFKSDIDKKFSSFCELYPNCSDATNYTLNYFFPVTENIFPELFMQFYKAITFPLWCVSMMGSLPGSSLCGAPPLVATPPDVMKKALLLSVTHGENKLKFFNRKSIPAKIAGDKFFAKPQQQLMS